MQFYFLPYNISLAGEEGRFCFKIWFSLMILNFLYLELDWIRMLSFEPTIKMPSGYSSSSGIRLLLFSSNFFCIRLTLNRFSFELGAKYFVTFQGASPIIVFLKLKGNK